MGPTEKIQIGGQRVEPTLHSTESSPLSTTTPPIELTSKSKGNPSNFEVFTKALANNMKIATLSILFTYNIADYKEDMKEASKAGSNLEKGISYGLSTIKCAGYMLFSGITFGLYAPFIPLTSLVALGDALTQATIGRTLDMRKTGEARLRSLTNQLESTDIHFE